MTVPDKPQAEVVSVDAGGRVRTHFAGLFEDAVRFVENNFPRLHVEPNSNQAPKADVFVKTEHGNTAFHGADSGGDNGWHDVDDHGNLVEKTEPETPDNEAPETE